MFFSHQLKKGFTLIELMVVVSIIAILSSILFINFNDARMLSRDKARMTSLKEVQLALEFYKAQYGRYPAPCSPTPVGNYGGPGPVGAGNLSSCVGDYIVGHTAGATFVPDFISKLPTDPMFENEPGLGFYYRTNTDGSSYKLMVREVAETLTVNSFGDDFARCPYYVSGGECPFGAPQLRTYAVYSSGAEGW